MGRVSLTTVNTDYSQEERIAPLMAYGRNLKAEITKGIRNVILVELLATIAVASSLIFTTGPESPGLEPLFVLVFSLTVLTLAFALMQGMFGYISRTLSYICLCTLLPLTYLLILKASRVEVSYLWIINAGLPFLLFALDGTYLVRKLKSLEPKEALPNSNIHRICFTPGNTWKEFII